MSFNRTAVIAGSWPMPAGEAFRPVRPRGTFKVNRQVMCRLRGGRCPRWRGAAAVDEAFQ